MKVKAKLIKDKFQITYEGKAGRDFVLKSLGKTTDKQGYLIDKKTKKHVLDAWGRKFKPSKMMGIIKKQWITSPLQLLDKKFESSLRKLKTKK